MYQQLDISEVSGNMKARHETSCNHNHGTIVQLLNAIKFVV